MNYSINEARFHEIHNPEFIKKVKDMLERNKKR